jgi:hypothetical protein
MWRGEESATLSRSVRLRYFALLIPRGLKAPRNDTKSLHDEAFCSSVIPSPVLWGEESQT